MKIFLFLIAGLALFNSCTSHSQIIKNNEKPVGQSVIEGTKGLIVLADGYNKPNDFIRFYNEDGSLWYEFTFYYKDEDGKFEYENKEFSPYAFHPDNFLLAVKYVDEDANRFKVIVNDEKGLVKYVNKADKNLKVQTWEAHLLKTFSIKFKEKENPLRESPDGTIKSVDYSKPFIFDPADIDGEWQKVKWDTEPNPEHNPAKTDYGWIKWKQGEKLLVSWFYFA